MIKAVIFDMYETLITHFSSQPYFSKQIAEDASIPVAQFKELWEPTDSDRTTGKATLEETLTSILKEKQVYSKEVLDCIVQKRIAAKEDCFHYLYPGIIPLLTGLKERGIKVGLISNCYSEEAEVIRRSILFPYFDAVCMSYEEGVQKPDAEIYFRCMEKLVLQAQDCLYVGDGGSNELEAAETVGMTAVQAVWYLKDNVGQPCGRKVGFRQIENPLDILEMGI